MLRRPLCRVLLSLVLLLAQQMAISHALSHWTSQIAGPVARQALGDAELSSAFAQDRSCAQCLGLAELASPLPHAPRAYTPPESTEILALEAAGADRLARSARLFDSRAPPVLG